MRKGTLVTWKYGTGTATGKIEHTFKESVTRKLQGAEITRHATADNPAFLIVQSNGARVLKFKSEVQAVNK
ncbi:hypervirulence associated TUDOR domain-containing protein [Hymenobacter coalescens]